jgi:hypothetical protein
MQGYIFLKSPDKVNTFVFLHLSLEKTLSVFPAGLKLNWEVLNENSFTFHHPLKDNSFGKIKLLLYQCFLSSCF